MIDRTRLHYAALEGDESLVAQLLADGADPNAQDSQGFTALHFASQSYEPLIVGLLLEGGAEVDQTNGVGNTALGLAVFNSAGRGDVIELLLGAGACSDRPNNAGVSPRVLAERIANYDILQFFPDWQRGA